ncbi:hypothetical protein [Sandarakinorhabdus sp.]|uniref:hypothetical protein n=1 Tax=Sandarakinorhabdus sp. TaxID=1916663 RepID=UPI00286DE777|nr:hypothetical protein [Sandarakinorhabdus sp.]
MTFVLAAAAMLLGVSAAAGPLVVRASGPSAASFKPGQRLPDAPLVLKAGDMVMVLDTKGTRSFSGPGSFSFSAPSAAASQPAFAALLVQKPERRARIGAVRGSRGEEKGAPVPPGIWAVDAGISSTVCARDPAAISLWRADPQAPATLTITRASDGAAASLAFAGGQAVAGLPAAVAGSAGTLRITGGKTPVAITIKSVSPAADIEALGAQFVAQGCDGQFARLAKLTVQPQ